MNIPIIVAFFKYKLVTNIIILACWPDVDRVNLLKSLSQNGVKASFLCDSNFTDLSEHHRIQGFLYTEQYGEKNIKKLPEKYFSIWYKWLFLTDIPNLKQWRYDSDLALLQTRGNSTELYDVFIHPENQMSLHPWAFWSIEGLKVRWERERILRRKNLIGYRLKIAAAVVEYTEDYNGSFEKYLKDNTHPEQDSAIRCGHSAAELLAAALNATVSIIPAHTWISMADNSSVLRMVSSGAAELGGSPMRMRLGRLHLMDYVLPIWPFRVGFIYLAERASSTDMYLEPFSQAVWLCSAAIGLLLALVMYLTSKSNEERSGAVISTLATFLQQDAGTVPEGISGRLTFTWLSIWAMLMNAYYTSAIVSALMSGGTSGPDSLQSLAESKYGIASEDYDFMRYYMFGNSSDIPHLDYLKKKKMTSSLYQPISMGVELIKRGDTAYHGQYNHIYPYLRGFSDEHLCKLSYVDTIPETPLWVVTTKYSEYKDVMRSAGSWVRETGLTKRILSLWLIKPAPCRSSMLAERVTFGDVSSLIVFSVFGVALSAILFGVEVLVAKRQKRNNDSQL